MRASGSLMLFTVMNSRGVSEEEGERSQKETGRTGEKRAFKTKRTADEETRRSKGTYKDKQTL